MSNLLSEWPILDLTNQEDKDLYQIQHTPGSYEVTYDDLRLVLDIVMRTFKEIENKE